jgi:uncharacterized DUF497 family protein
MNGFGWDDENVSHIARHGVTPKEIEELFRRPYAIEVDEPVNGEERFLAHGTTARGRYLTVVCADRKGSIRPITAWDMTREDREQYADEIHE